MTAALDRVDGWPALVAADGLLGGLAADRTLEIARNLSAGH